MIQIEEHKEAFLESTFISPKLLKKFQEKYNKDDGSFTLSLRGTVSVIILDAFEPFKYQQLVFDWGSYSGLTIVYKSRKAWMTISLQQTPGFCGIINIVSPGTSLLNSGEIMETVLDFLSLMGYTVVMMSLKAEVYQKLAEERGFIPYMAMKNRRTDNHVILYYKRLNSTFQ